MNNILIKIINKDKLKVETKDENNTTQKELLINSEDNTSIEELIEIIILEDFDKIEIENENDAKEGEFSLVMALAIKNGYEAYYKKTQDQISKEVIE